MELESLYLSGIRSGDYGLNWLWRSCKQLNKLQLRNCESVGDNPSFSSFLNCLNDLEEVELRTCRPIVDGILLKLAESCTMNSLLIYDGGSNEGLLQFITQSRSTNSFEYNSPESKGGTYIYIYNGSLSLGPIRIPAL